MNLACDTCPVRDRAACAVLTDEERDALAKTGRTRVLKAGETLFVAGDEDTVCATLLTGALKVTSIDEEGNELILALIHPAGFVGEMFRPFADYDVVALTESRLCVFPRSAMKSALDEFPALTQALFRRAQEDVHNTRQLLELTSRGTSEGKVAALLLMLAHAASDSPCHPASSFTLPLSRGEMGQMLGLTIETVSRRLTGLEKSGMIRKNGTRGIDLLDPARLRFLVKAPV
ncbi:Crp/Fnr family transcriptional regulator [Erythrobacter sp. HKB08]|uniref:Crp/Fnr family transcriptional regulator n=1 Tax=Erythrobacter sp. HKB08 TaxID=2502843 RepID=UPI001008DB5E|nr:Crp/Fnr family transcriptional regulator [Erythrobacter sp. HKB08]